MAVRVRIRPSRSSSNGRTNPNSTSSSHTYVFLASRAGSEIPERSPSFGECPTLVAFEPLQLGEDVNQRGALFRSTIPLGSNLCARKNRLQYGSSASELELRFGRGSRLPIADNDIDISALPHLTMRILKKSAARPGIDERCWQRLRSLSAPSKHFRSQR